MLCLKNNHRGRVAPAVGLRQGESVFSLYVLLPAKASKQYIFLRWNSWWKVQGKRSAPRNALLPPELPVLVSSWHTTGLQYVLINLLPREDRIYVLYSLGPWSGKPSHCLPTLVPLSSVASAWHFTKSQPLVEEKVGATSTLWYHWGGGCGGIAEATSPLAPTVLSFIGFLVLAYGLSLCLHTGPFDGKFANLHFVGQIYWS